MLLVVSAVIVALAVAILAARAAIRGRGVARLYWLACSVPALLGIAGLVLVMVFPPEHFDEAGRLIGEMPPEFALAFTLASWGLAGALAGFAGSGLARLYRRWRGKAGS